MPATGQARAQRSLKTLNLRGRQPINPSSTSTFSKSPDFLETDDGIGSLAGSTSGKHDLKINE